MSELTPAMKANFTKLGQFKVQAKNLDEKISALQKKIFDALGKDAPKKYELATGNLLCKGSRTNYSKPSNDAALEVIGKAAFLKHASITKTAINTAGGEAAVSELTERGEIKVTSVSEYYSLKGKC